MERVEENEMTKRNVDVVGAVGRSLLKWKDRIPEYFREGGLESDKTGVCKS